jgi:RNA recognition motif-containing protein
MTNIFIGGLAYAMTDADLRKLFEPYGTVEKVTILRDRETNRSRGFGFVEMPNDNEAAAAIKVLNGKTIAGRSIRVNEARKRPAGAFGNSERERKRGRF